jgi:hypothetical protein
MWLLKLYSRLMFCIWSWRIPCLRSSVWPVHIFYCSWWEHYYISAVISTDMVLCRSWCYWFWKCAYHFVVEHSNVIKYRPYWWWWRLLSFGMWHRVVWQIGVSEEFTPVSSQQKKYKWYESKDRSFWTWGCEWIWPWKGPLWYPGLIAGLRIGNAHTFSMLVRHSALWLCFVSLCQKVTRGM